jgi:hypothetical protein
VSPRLDRQREVDRFVRVSPSAGTRLEARRRDQNGEGLGVAGVGDPLVAVM